MDDALSGEFLLGVRPVLTITMFLCYSIFCVNLHLFGRNMNHHAGVSKANLKTPNSTSLLGLLCHN